jgi:predicted HicB family RNase H-like nuclease
MSQKIPKDQRKEALQAIVDLEKKQKASFEPVKQALEELRKTAEKRKSRGGARTGAGRKKVEKPASEKIIFRLTEDDTKALEKYKEEGESLNQTARRLLKERITK